MGQINNIEVHNDLREDKNNRVLILHQNGEVDVITSPIGEVSYYHMLYFKEYLNKKYLEDEVLQKYKDVSSQPAIIIYFLLKKYGDVIFTETTKDGELKRYGIIYFPDFMTREQVEKIESLKDNYLNGFTELLVQAGYYIDEYNMINNRVYEQVVVPNYQKLDEQMIIEEKVK